MSACTDPQSLTERDPNALVKFYIPGPPVGDIHTGSVGEADADSSNPVKRDPNALVKFYIPEDPPAVDDIVTPADVNKRFYIYPPPSVSSDDETMPTKRDPNTLVKFYIPEAPTDSE